MNMYSNDTWNVHHMHFLCPVTSEEGVIHPGTGVLGGYRIPGVGTRN